MVARQLGHANAVLVHNVYGRFAPNQEERTKWEQTAAAAAAAREREAAVYQFGYHSEHKAVRPETTKSLKPSGSNDLANSRGGTRTRDPGIMSAVL